MAVYNRGMDKTDQEKIAAIQRKAMDERDRRLREAEPPAGRMRIKGLDYETVPSRVMQWILYILAHAALVILPFFIVISAAFIALFVDSHFWQIVLAVPVLAGSLLLYRLGRKPATGRDRYQRILKELDEYYDKRHALQALEELASEGYVPAQVHLGEAYQFGKVVTRNAMTASKWYRQAARRNSAEGQLRLAALLVDGAENVPRDIPEAIRLYEASYRNGSPAAALALAQLYEEGIGMDADREQAAQWYYRAAQIFQARKRPEDLAMARKAIAAIAADHPLIARLGKAAIPE
jgi:hypothetical protein